MNFYKLNYTTEKVLGDVSAPEQALLKKYLGADFPEREAKYLWSRIVDHKWFIGERLRRDVGLRVAAVDYFENFYEPVFFIKRRNGFKNSLRELFKMILRTEFLRPKSL